MSLFSNTQQIAATGAGHISDFRKLYEFHSLSFGSPADFLQLAPKLASSEGFRLDLSDLARTIRDKESGRLSARDVLTIAALAIGGPGITSAEDELAQSAGTVLILLAGVGGWREAGSSPSPAETSSTSETGVPPPDSPSDAPPKSPIPAPRRGTPFADAAQRSDVSPEMKETLARLELASLQLKVYLDDIDRRMGRIEPHLEDITAMVHSSAEYFQKIGRDPQPSPLQIQDPAPNDQIRPAETPSAPRPRRSERPMAAAMDRASAEREPATAIPIEPPPVVAAESHPLEPSPSVLPPVEVPSEDLTRPARRPMGWEKRSFGARPPSDTEPAPPLVSDLPASPPAVAEPSAPTVAAPPAAITPPASKPEAPTPPVPTPAAATPPAHATLPTVPLPVVPLPVAALPIAASRRTPKSPAAKSQAPVPAAPGQAVTTPQPAAAHASPRPVSAPTRILPETTPPAALSPAALSIPKPASQTALSGPVETPTDLLGDDTATDSSPDKGTRWSLGAIAALLLVAAATAFLYGPWHLAPRAASAATQKSDAAATGQATTPATAAPANRSVIGTGTSGPNTAIQTPSSTSPKRSAATRAVPLPTSPSSTATPRDTPPPSNPSGTSNPQTQTGTTSPTTTQPTPAAQAAPIIRPDSTGVSTPTPVTQTDPPPTNRVAGARAEDTPRPPREEVLRPVELATNTTPANSLPSRVETPPAANRQPAPSTLSAGNSSTLVDIPRPSSAGPLPTPAIGTVTVLSAPTPIYPEEARRLGVGGKVEIEATVDRTGAVTHLRVLKGPALLRQSAQDAVRLRRYKPLLLHGEPSEFQTVVTLNYHLPQ